MAINESIKKVLSGQKIIIWSFIGSAVSSVPAIISHPLVLIPAVCVGFSAIGCWRVLSGIGYNIPYKICMFALSFIPFFNVLGILSVNSDATKFLRSAGLRVGLFGAKARRYMPLNQQTPVFYVPSEPPLQVIDNMKIMIIGFGESGKTYFLGSLFRLALEAGKQGFSVQVKDPTEIGWAQQVNKKIEQGLVIPRTTNKVDCDLVLRQGIQEVLDINIIDVEGQAISGDNKDVAEKLRKIALGCDAFVIIVKAPENDNGERKAMESVAQSLNFLVAALNSKRAPVILLLNQIDLLPEACGIKDKFDQVLDDLKDETKGNPRAFLTAKENKLGKLTCQFIDPILKSHHCYSIINQFFRQLRGKQLPNKVFITTSCGFDNPPPSSVNDPDSTESYVIRPYGTAAAFLWTIYAGLKISKEVKVRQNSLDKDALSSALLNDIQTIYTSGKAYYNNDSEDKIWHERDISNLYSSEEWEEV